MPLILARRGLLAGAVGLTVAPARAAVLARTPLLVAPPLHITGGIALTLDACPGGFDARIAQALADAAIPTTIFVTATWMRWNPHALAFLLAQPALFRLENHGARHIPAVLGDGRVYGIPAAGSLDAIRQEVTDGAAAVSEASGHAPLWYRDATARYSVTAIDAIHQLGFAIGGYSLNADEGASLPAASVAARIAQAKPGEVIIGHINQPHRPSGAGIVAGVLALHRQGMRFVHLPNPEG